MKPIVFLASADAMKPVILIDTFYESVNRDSKIDILLTDGESGRTIDLAMRRGMKIIRTPDQKFNDKAWIEKNFVNVHGVLVSCGWPYKIPLDLINIFSAAVNCHGSYLPDYRGSRAYMHYWANCSDFFGATIHYINENFDDGNILVRGKQRMFPNETQNEVFIRTAELCGHLLPAALSKIELGDKGFVINNERARYFFKRTPEEFEEYRHLNEKRLKNGLEPLLTPHKTL